MNNMDQIEGKIRDKLATRLDLFGIGLELINTEEFLPNATGTRGFVDLFARNAEGKFFLIELKRSKAASRQAIHEVLKYIEGIKENKSLMNDEIVAIVVSTEWSELLVPFSSFVHDTSYTVIGYDLQVGEDGNPLKAVAVEPLIFMNERFLSDMHSIALYTSSDNLKKGIKSHVDCFNHKNITDYVLLILKAHPALYEYSLNSTMKALEGIARFGDPLGLSFEDLRNKMDEYLYMVYSSVQVMEKSDYWQIINNDELLFQEAKENLPEWSIKDELHHLHHYAIMECEPLPFCERCEIGYPAKLSDKLLNHEGWEVIQLVRGGRLERNTLLTDDVIIDELKGSTGTNKIIYHKKFSSNYPSSISKLQADVEKCLVDNAIWLVGVKRAIADIARVSKDHDCEVDVHIYNPSNTLLSLYHTIRYVDPDNIMRWLPKYEISIMGKDIRRSYFGCLEYKSVEVDLQHVIQLAYGGNASELVRSMAWGGYQQNDIDISLIYGLEYSNFLIITNETEQKYFKFNGFQYVDCQVIGLYDGIIHFMNVNTEFIDSLQKLFDEHNIIPGILHFSMPSDNRMLNDNIK